MIHPLPHSGSRALSRAGRPTTVKYSLRELLDEIEEEKSFGTIATEQLPQADIAKVFQHQTLSRRASSSQ